MVAEARGGQHYFSVLLLTGPNNGILMSAVRAPYFIKLVNAIMVPIGAFLQSLYRQPCFRPLPTSGYPLVLIKSCVTVTTHFYSLLLPLSLSLSIAELVRYLWRPGLACLGRSQLAAQRFKRYLEALVV